MFTDLTTFKKLSNLFCARFLVLLSITLVIFQRKSVLSYFLKNILMCFVEIFFPPKKSNTAFLLSIVLPPFDILL